MYIIEQVKDVINNKNVCINFWSSDLTDDNIFNHIKNGSIKETVKQCLKNSNIIKDDYSSFGVMVYRLYLDTHSVYIALIKSIISHICAVLGLSLIQKKDKIISKPSLI